MAAWNHVWCYNFTVSSPIQTSSSSSKLDSFSLYSPKRSSSSSSLLHCQSFHRRFHTLSPTHFNSKTSTIVSAISISTESVADALPPALDSTSDPPSVFDGTTRLYISYSCPFAQRAWITRNCKGLQEKIELVPINLKNRPAWYKEKVYPANKVPSLEHNNEVRGESLDLIRYIDSNFEGPSLYPDDPAKREFAEELLSYTDSFSKAVLTSFQADGVVEEEAGAAFDYIETALSKFDDGPYFLGQFSLVDIAYAPFIERYQPYLLEVKKYDMTSDRPKLAAWIEEINKIEGYKQTRRDTEELLASYKKRFLGQV